jgi:hypothetical protein
VQADRGLGEAPQHQHGQPEGDGPQQGPPARLRGEGLQRAALVGLGAAGAERHPHRQVGDGEMHQAIPGEAYAAKDLEVLVLGGLPRGGSRVVTDLGCGGHSVLPARRMHRGKDPAVPSTFGVAWLSPDVAVRAGTSGRRRTGTHHPGRPAGYLFCAEPRAGLAALGAPCGLSPVVLEVV